MIQLPSILSIPFYQGDIDSVLEEMFETLRKRRDPCFITTPNPEIVVKAQSDAQFRKALNEAELSLADGVGITLAANLLGIEAIHRIPGVELVEYLCKEAAKRSSEGSKKPISIGFLGGRRNVAEKTAKCLEEKYPGLHVVFVAEEWGEDGFYWQRRSKSKEGRDMKDKKITAQDSNQNSHTIDILFVAFGSPKQEVWMMDHRGKIPAHVMIGVGGAFDFISGEVPRAPKVIRNIGLEWLFRLMVQPWRWRRQLALFTFMYLVLKEKVSK